MTHRLYHRLSFGCAIFALLGACASGPAEPRADLLGMAIPASAAAHSVVITPATRWIAVTGGDTVRFVVGGTAFGWDFHVSPLVQSFDLNRVAPPGLLGRPLPVYVEPDPNTTSGGDWRAPPRQGDAS